jgi:hypothetical protein
MVREGNGGVRMQEAGRQERPEGCSSTHLVVAADNSFGALF